VLGGGKGLIVGRQLQVENGPAAEVTAVLEGAHRLVRFARSHRALPGCSAACPLPPYIHAALHNPERYQTVYSRDPGSAAAPTAGCTSPRS